MKPKKTAQAEAKIDGEARVNGETSDGLPSVTSGVSCSPWSDLRIAVADGWGTLTFHRPQRRNAMSETMLRELDEATALLVDADLKGLVITGAGDAFSVGGDLDALRSHLHDSTADVAAISRAHVGCLQQTILNIRRMPFPVVAAVNGLAAGSGFGLALACDDRVASPRATFKAAYGAAGLSPDAGLTYLLPRIVGDACARSIILGDEVLRARQSERLGLVSEVVEESRLQVAALRRLRRLARWAPRSIAVTKHLLQTTWHDGFADHLQRERHLLADACKTEDFREGVEAFHAGRRPHFEGR